MKRSDIFVICAFYAICLAVYTLVLGLPEEAQTYPTALICGLALLNTLYLGKSIRLGLRNGVQNDLPAIFEGFQTRQFFGVVILALIYIALMPLIGFYLASLLFLIVSMVFLRVPKLHMGLTVLVLAGLVYAVFALFLKVPLPVGQLWQ